MFVCKWSGGQVNNLHFECFLSQRVYLLLTINEEIVVKAED